VKQGGPRPQPGLPEPPDVLSPEALDEWHRIAPELHRLGYLTRLDTAVLAAYAQSYGRWVIAERALGSKLLSKSRLGADVANPLASLARHAAADTARYAAELGLTPAGRQRLAGIAPAEEAPDPAAKYLGA